MFIDTRAMEQMLESAKLATEEQINAMLDKAERFEGLAPEEVAALLQSGPQHLPRINAIAGQIKRAIYGNRIVMFAPLYVSDHCVNRCAYCGYNVDHKFPRRRLTQDEIRGELAILERMGHKRIALEAGEHPAECGIDYILECIRTIYDTKLGNGEIRRVNVNIAATTVENYRRLRDVGIGTYILFQETYHPETYARVHLAGPKANYEYHLTAFDRAMQAGIDDVGGGVLFGLHADWKFEVLGLMLHNRYLEQTHGVGMHTISVPRICPADGVDETQFAHPITDEDFKKLVAIIRLAVPFTGMILSTRENQAMRAALLQIGISQISAGSAAEVGGYKLREQGESTPQFRVTDERSASDIITWVMDNDFIPSFCTACYRSGRTGDRFMQLAKSGNIKNVCHPNALLTLCEYMCDYGDAAFREKAEALIARELPRIPNEKVRALTKQKIERICSGERDLFL